MGSVNDPNNDRHRLQKRMEDVEDLPDEEREVIEYFADNYGDKYAESTLERHLGHLLMIREELSTSVLEATELQWTNAISRLERENDWTSGTKRNKQKSVRAFLGEAEKYVNAEKEDISLARDDSGGKVKEEDILDPDEISILIEEASNRTRDKAMFSALIDLGFRVAALCSLRVQDYEPQPENGIAEIELNEDALGTKGSEGRTHVTTMSTAYIDRYLADDHPRPSDDDAPLFHKSSGKWDEDDPEDDGSISPMIFRRRMKRLARDFEIDTEKLHPHNIKHAAVTRWARMGMSDREIEHRAGWTRESGQLDRYEHITDSDINQSILAKSDIDVDVEDANEVPTMENCPRCGYVVDPSFSYCGNCGQQLEQEAFPEWFEDYEDMYGEDDLVTHLKSNPASIPKRPADLDMRSFSEHQNKLESFLGYSLAMEMPAPEEFQLELKRANDDGTVLMSVPSAVINEGEPTSVRTTADGATEVLDEDGDVLFREE